MISIFRERYEGKENEGKGGTKKREVEGLGLSKGKGWRGKGLLSTSDS